MLRCCACTEHMMRDQALVFCSHSASCADKGAVVESKVTGYWRASPMVENSALPDRHLSLRGLRNAKVLSIVARASVRRYADAAAPQGGPRVGASRPATQVSSFRRAARSSEHDFVAVTHDGKIDTRLE